MCTCSTNGTCLPTRLPPPPPPRIEFVSRATRAGTTNPRTGLWAVDASVPVWPYTPGRSHTRKSRQARAMAFVLSGRRGLITRWKRHAIAKNNRRNPVRPTATPTTRADVVVVVVIKTEYRFENVFLNANNALHDYYYFILLIIGFGNNNHNNNNNRSSTGFTPPPFAYFCAIRNSLFEWDVCKKHILCTSDYKILYNKTFQINRDKKCWQHYYSRRLKLLATNAKLGSIIITVLN